MPTAKKKRRPLSAIEKEFVLRLIAEFRTGGFVTSAFQKEFGRSISSSLVTYYRQNFPAEIASYRAQLKFALDSIPIASKFWRLSELQSLYEKANNYRLVRFARGTDKRGNPKRIPIYEKPVGELRQLLTLAAQEMGDLKEVVEVRENVTDEYRAEFETGETYSSSDTSETPDVSDESVN